MSPLADMLNPSGIRELLHSSTGLELVEQQVLVMLMNGLSDQLQLQQDAWDPIDVNFAKARDVPYTEVVLEVPHLRDYHRGSAPSVLRQSPDRFPTLAVMADRARRDPESDLMDHQHVFRDLFWVEAIVRSGPFDPDDVDYQLEAEDVVGRRAKRTAEAIVQTIFAEPTLGGVISPIGYAPEVTHSDPFELQSLDNDSSGESRIFVASRVDFTLKKYSPVPDSSQPPPGVVPVGLGI